MLISRIKDATYIGRVRESEKKYSGSKPVFYQNKLEIEYSKELQKGFVGRHLSIVYFICVDDVIYKIGQTSGKTGIKGCLEFYCCAGQDDPGQNRFIINALMREKLKNKQNVDIYIKYLEPIKYSISGIDREHDIITPISAKCLEQVHLEEYKDITGTNPLWNFQESGTPVPSYINENYTSYVKMRSRAR